MRSSSPGFIHCTRYNYRLGNSPPSVKMSLETIFSSFELSKVPVEYLKMIRMLLKEIEDTGNGSTSPVHGSKGLRWWLLEIYFLCSLSEFAFYFLCQQNVCLHFLFCKEKPNAPMFLINFWKHTHSIYIFFSYSYTHVLSPFLEWESPESRLITILPFLLCRLNIWFIFFSLEHGSSSRHSTNLNE